MLLGTSQLATNQYGQKSWKEISEAFGQVTPESANLITMNLLFPGQYFDGETRLSNNYFRDYEGATGRYVQPDPIGLEGGWNRFFYVGGNPLSGVDPWGLKKLILFPTGTPEYAAASQVPDTPGILTVYGHGNENMVSPTPDGQKDGLNAQGLKDTILHDPDYKSGMLVQLMSCDAGSGDNPIAKQLSRLLDSKVSGYDGKVVYIPQTPFNPPIVSPFPWASNYTYKK